MIKGIGLDAVDLARIKEIITHKPRFIPRILTKAEIGLFESHTPHRQVEFLAGRYACKEAFAKAWGTGIGQVGFQDMEILTDAKGAPIFTKSPFNGTVFVSITHTDSIALAQVILEE